MNIQPRLAQEEDLTVTIRRTWDNGFAWDEIHLHCALAVDATGRVDLWLPDRNQTLTYALRDLMSDDYTLVITEVNAA